MMEKDKSKIGDKFEYNGKWYQVIQEGMCSNCAFRSVDCSALQTKNAIPQCFKSDIKDDERETAFIECKPPTEPEKEPLTEKEPVKEGEEVKAKEYAVGEIFEYKQALYKVKNGKCGKCAFQGEACGRKRDKREIPYCRELERVDGKNVRFELVPSTIKNLIKARLSEARAKHPIFPETTPEAMSILLEEVGELAKAVNDSEGKEREESELLDIIAVCIRMIENFEMDMPF